MLITTFHFSLNYPFAVYLFDIRQYSSVPSSHKQHSRKSAKKLCQSYSYTRPKIRFMHSQKWNCAASSPIPTFMYLCVINKFPGSVCLFGCSKIGKWILRIHKSLTKHECGNWATEHYNYVSKITRPHSFISGNTSFGTRHLYWILTSPSFAV